MKAVIAPNPTLLNAAPRPGAQTTPSTRRNDGRCWVAGATPRTGATKARVTSGASVVATAPRERAEHYGAELRRHGLRVSVESDN